MDKVTPISSNPRKLPSDARLSETGQSDEEQILQIRELLFGEQVRTHDQHVERLFHLLDKRLDALAENLGRRLDKVESQIQQLSSALEQETQEREQVVCAAIHSFEKNVQQLEQDQALGVEHTLLQEREELAAALRSVAAGFDRKHWHKD